MTYAPPDRAAVANDDTRPHPRTADRRPAPDDDSTHASGSRENGAPDASKGWVVVEKLLLTVLTRGLDESDVRAKTRAREPEALVSRYARRAAFRSLLLGVPGGGWALALGVVDVASSVNLRTEMAAAIAHHHDPELFEDPTWRQRVVGAAYGVPDDQRDVKNVAVRAVRDAVLRRGARMLVRRIATKTVPLAGGVVSAGLAYVWMTREGRRIDRTLRDEDVVNTRT